jgi:hypothetical protein
MKTSEYSFDVREVTVTGYSPVTEKTLLLDGEKVLIGADDELFDTKEEALQIVLEKYEYLKTVAEEILETINENYLKAVSDINLISKSEMPFREYLEKLEGK